MKTITVFEAMKRYVNHHERKIACLGKLSRELAAAEELSQKMVLSHIAKHVAGMALERGVLTDGEEVENFEPCPVFKGWAPGTHESKEYTAALKAWCAKYAPNATVAS